MKSTIRSAQLPGPGVKHAETVADADGRSALDQLGRQVAGKSSAHAQPDTLPEADMHPVVEENDPMRIDLDETRSVSASLIEAWDPFALIVLAHGAGAGMAHPFMNAVASRLATAGVSVLRYQFPYMEAGSRRPDMPAVAQSAIRAAVAAAANLTELPLFAGGKSFGGRMTSQAQAAEALPGVRGLVFLGFPLHPAGKPGIERARHLNEVPVPMLFLQGTRDTLADNGLLAEVLARLPGATLTIVEDADHSFHVPKRTGRTDMQVLDYLCTTAAAWMRAVVSHR